MIVLLKIILSLFIVLGIFIANMFYKDFKSIEKTQEYEESMLADKIKVQSVLYFSMIAICGFCLLLLYYVIIPIQITPWNF